MKDYYLGIREKIVETGHLKEIDRYEEEAFGVDSQDLAKT